MKRLTNSTKLNLLKSVHTAIWCVFVIALLYILYAGIFNSINMLVWVCIGLIFVECVILLIYKCKCPFTLLCQKYTDNHRVGFDIFLPVWLAKNNKTIFGIIFAIGLVLVIWRVFIQ